MRCHSASSITSTTRIISSCCDIFPVVAMRVDAARVRRGSQSAFSGLRGTATSPVPTAQRPWPGAAAESCAAASGGSERGWDAAWASRHCCRSELAMPTAAPKNVSRADDNFAWVARPALAERVAERYPGMDRPRPVRWRVSHELVLLPARPALGQRILQFRPKIRSYGRSSFIDSGSIPWLWQNWRYAIGEISLGLISLRPPQKTLV